MADEDGTATEANEPEAGDASANTTDWKAEAEKWKALSRKHEGQAKSNADAATELQKIKDAGKSEVEKLTDQLAKATKDGEGAVARALRLEVAMAKGLTAAQAKRLVGSTKEELEADADELLSTFKPADTAGPSDTDDEPTTGKPREALRPGTTSAGDEQETSIDEALKRIKPIN